MGLGMGLSMNQINQSKSDIRLITLVYLSALAIIPAIFFSLSPGCTEEIKEKEAILGQEYSEKDVFGAINKYTENQSLVKAGKNSGVQYEYNNKVETGNPFILANRVRWVKAIAETETQKVWTINDRIVIYNNDGSIKDDSTKELNFAFDKQQPKIAPQQSEFFANAQRFQINKLKERFTQLNITEKSKEIKYTYHHLRIDKYQKSAPKIVQEREECGNACNLQINSVRFTQAIWQEGQLLDKVDFTFEFTDEIPFLFSYQEKGFIYPVNQQCAGYKARANGRDYYIKDCKVLKDFSN